MITFAHRGASGDYPENTLLAFKKAIALGASGIELDVHKTKDNHLVVIHDEDIERTFKGKGLIAERTLEELKEVPCRKLEYREHPGCGICTLKDVLELLVVHEQIHLNIELKTDEIAYEGIEVDVIGLVEAYKMVDRVILSSFNHESITKCKTLAPHIKTGALYHYPIENVVEYALGLGVEAIHPNVALVSKELIKECHKHNILVNTYTVNSPHIMRLLLEAQVDGIFTDYPELLLEIAREMRTRFVNIRKI